MAAPSGNLKIRRAANTETSVAYRIVREYYSAACVVALETRAEFVREYFAPGCGVWLAWMDGQVAGCLALRRMGHPANCVEIKRMYVREKWRGLGIAQKLLEGTERFARESGYQRIYLDTTDEMKAAARLYERNGYERCERYNENPQATIFMRKNL